MARMLGEEETLFFPYEESGKYHLKYVAYPTKREIADWRYGPAQLWYDMLDVSETGDGFTYGFKMSKVSGERGSEDRREDFPDESFLMVAQNTWEEDIVWDDSAETREKVLKTLSGRMNAAGWLPSTNTRTATVFSQFSGSTTPFFKDPTADSTAVDSQALCTFKSTRGSPPLAKHSSEENSDDATWYSIFPVENEELIYGTWEDDIIWDSEAVPRIPQPKLLTLDPNDENIILGVPEDVDPRKQRTEIVTPTKVKVTHPHIQKSKLLLGKAGVINVLKDDTPPQCSKPRDQDPFNVSNDSYYFPRSSDTSIKLKSSGGNIIQHSTPVVELQAPFIQTQAAGVGLICSRNGHRPPLRRFTHGVNADPGPHTVVSLSKYIKKKAKVREQERIASGGGDMFFMRTAEDLTGRDGELILVEFCEEHPPLINQVGMCSRVKNYYKRRANKDHGPTHYRYGELAYAHTSPFLGTLSPGQSIQVVENNMYRAPIYEHEVPDTHFLVIRTRNQYFIRQFDALFTAGQLCPLYEVPGPNSKQANQFVRDFLQVFIYRLFWRSADTPKRIRMEDVKKAFPMHSEGSIRKRLKQCADFKRTGRYSNWWVIKPDFRLPSEEEIRMMVLPEQCCAYFSMIAAEQRLKDAGYGEKFLFAPEDDDEDLQLKMDDEIKVAPWNTTRAYIQAMKGKCLLQLTGPADPTGCGEGFSYVRMPNKPPTKPGREQQETSHKRSVNGTDADLRKLSLEKARNLLRKFGVPEDEIKKLSRWEVIDVIRTLSNEKAKAGEKVMSKYSRGNRFSAAENQERYREECQRIFDLQNRVLASGEVLSTDEGETSQEEDDLDLDEMGKNIENMLANRKMKFTQMSMEQEERERQELRRIMLREDDCKMNNKKMTASSRPFSSLDQSNRVLKIYRTFRDSEGGEYTRMEIVRNQAVIDAYVKIRTTKNESLMKQLTAQDEAQKDEIRRQKRRIKDRLRRNERKLKKKLIAAKVEDAWSVDKGLVSSNDELAANPLSRKPRPVKAKTDAKVKCGACGATGHMRTNRICPQRAPNFSLPLTNVALTEEQENEISKQLNENSENLVNVEGTKVKLSCKLIKAEDIRRRTLQLKFPKETLMRKRRRLDTEDRLDYLKKHQKPVNRRRTDPLVELSSILESILNEMRALPGVQPFLFPVSAKCVPDYYNIITKPMDLQTMRENLRQRKYQTREDFLSDVNQILENSTLYNGAKSQLTLDAKNMLEVCVDRLTAREDKLMALEKMINPLLDDDDQVALSFILSNIVSKLSTMSESWPFWKPVNRKAVKDYYDVVKIPMDLETILNHVKAHKYHSREEFLSDIQLILQNCIIYNGQGSPYSIRAEILLNTAQTCLDEYDEHLTILEQNIKLVQEKAEIESFNSSWFCADDDHNQEKYVGTGLSPYLREQFDYSSHSDPDPQKDSRKAEILAEDLHCSSEDGEVDSDIMEVVRSDHFGDFTFERVETGGPYISSESRTNNDPHTIVNKDSPLYDESLSLEDRFEMHDHFDDMMCGLSHQALDSSDHDFNMIGLEEEGQCFLDIGGDIDTFLKVDTKQGSWNTF